MKVIKRTAEYTVYKKRSGHYAVKSSGKQPINADEKVKILLSEGLIKIFSAGKLAPKPESEPVEEKAGEMVAEETPAEEPVEKKAEEEGPVEEVPAEKVAGESEFKAE